VKYKSTRGGYGGLSSAEAIKAGIAPDGGLFVPEHVVIYTEKDLETLQNLDYATLARHILEGYLDDFTREELAECTANAYNSTSFDDNRIAPVVKLSEQLYIQELWHGPTSAFKDMALQILPHLLTRAAKKTGESDEIVILVATSGDTGKAALAGFKDVPGTRIIVFYPEDGVSLIQKRQMVTQEGSNVHVVGVKGNFDDTQNGVKAIFVDEEIKELMKNRGLKFSSANSINWGRLVPQIVYYFYAYLEMYRQGSIKMGDKINIVVPTGNFGNILAAFYALKMGLPVNRLVCASNENNVLTEFINTGCYNRNREFKRTISPSMDILISSNLERLLFEITGHDDARVKNWMNSLKTDGIYYVDDSTKQKISEIFWAQFTTENEILATIQSIYQEYGCLVDTHTAVGIDVYDKYVISTGDMTPSVVAATASPFKFSGSVAGAVLGENAIIGKDEYEVLRLLSEKTGIPVPKGLKDLDKIPVRHTSVVESNGMKQQVAKILNL